MHRGDVVWVDLGVPIGSEAGSRRPAVIVSNDGANHVARTLARGVVTIVPVTSNTDRVFPFQVLIPAKRGGLASASKAQCEQVRSIDVRRVGKTIGRLPGPVADEVDAALRLHLSL